ncbi:helix-turn-helix domain-containing protein [Skermanella sp. TT6]|uniref:helix-turn-helix domain-containing protein n=1 Tax=Skermanella cutis TaxID=2775420 RepID=UPI00352FF878
MEPSPRILSSAVSIGPFLTVDEVAQILRVEPKEILRLIRMRVLGHHRIGRSLCVSENQLIRFVNDMRIDPCHANLTTTTSSSPGDRTAPTGSIATTIPLAAKFDSVQPERRTKRRLSVSCATSSDPAVPAPSKPIRSRRPSS